MTHDNTNENKTPYLPPLIANGCPESGYYICIYKNQWDSENRRSKRVSSTSVGRIQGNSKFGLCVFYESFLDKYPELRDYQIYRTEGPQRFVFIPKPGKAVEHSLQKERAKHQANAINTPILEEEPVRRHSSVADLAARAESLFEQDLTD